MFWKGIFHTQEEKTTAKTPQNQQQGLTHMDLADELKNFFSSLSFLPTLVGKQCLA